MHPVEPPRIAVIFYREAGLDYHTLAHRHPVHQWFVCIHGGLTIRIDGETYDLVPGEGLLIPPGALREPWCRRRAPGYLVVIFSHPWLDLVPLERQVVATPSVLAEDLRALVAELQAPRGGESPHLVQALVVRLLIGHLRQIREAAGTAAARDTTASHEVVAAAERFLAANLHRTLTRAEVAEAVRLSEPHLARLFKTVTGSAVLERLTAMRLERAKELLLETPLTVGEVASRVGFASFSHFTRLFRRQVGMVPSDYRRRGGRGYDL